MILRIPSTHYLALAQPRCELSFSGIAWSTGHQAQGAHHQATAGHPQQVDAAGKKNICQNIQKYSEINETTWGLAGPGSEQLVYRVGHCILLLRSWFKFGL